MSRMGGLELAHQGGAIFVSSRYFARLRLPAAHESILQKWMRLNRCTDVSAALPRICLASQVIDVQIEANPKLVEIGIALAKRA